MSERKKVLVTGSLGYIGTVLTKYLADRGFDCQGYDIGFFKECLLYEYEDTPTIYGDMRDFDKEVLDGVDAVVHLAAISNDPLENLSADEVYEPTRIYAAALTHECKERGIRLVFASTSSIFGLSQGSETLDEEAPKNPQTPYSENKWLIEQNMEMTTDDRFAPIMLRFATVFGSSPRLRLCVFLNMFVGMAFTSQKIVLNSDGAAWRPNIHIQDVCESIKRAIEYDGTLRETLALNVGTSELNYTVRQVAETIAQEVPGCELEFRGSCGSKIENNALVYDKKIHDRVDTRTYRLSFDKIEKEFPGFKCEWDLKKGILEMLDCFDNIGLTTEMFENVRFYRLRWLEELRKQNRITDDLRMV
jgi:nucleoside-diphosphate-sugar epimerase